MRWAPAQPSHPGSTLADVILTISSSLWHVRSLGYGSHHHFGTLYSSHLEPMGGSFISCHRKLFGWRRICLKIKTFCPGSWREMLEKDVWGSTTRKTLGVGRELSHSWGVGLEVVSWDCLSPVFGPLGERQAWFREKLVMNTAFSTERAFSVTKHAHGNTSSE